MCISMEVNKIKSNILNNENAGRKPPKFGHILSGDLMKLFFNSLSLVSFSSLELKTRGIPIITLEGILNFKF